MAVFVEVIAEQTLSLEAAAQLSSDEHTYFQTLVAMHLRDPQVQQHALEMVLGEEASALAEEMNNLLEQPAAVRFHAVATWTAREIYCLIVGSGEMFTSSYRGVFDRLIARMHQEALTGDALLSQVHDTRFRTFIKSIAMLNRLATFLTTMPSPVARWSLLTRCMSDLESCPGCDGAGRNGCRNAECPAGSRQPPADPGYPQKRVRPRGGGAQSAGAHHLRSPNRGSIQRHAAELTDPALRMIADIYLPALPALTGIL